MYFIEFGDVSYYFLINLFWGIIYMVKVLDREDVREYRISVKVLDLVVFLFDLLNVMNVYIIVLD